MFRLYTNFFSEELIEFYQAKKLIHEHCENNNPSKWFDSPADVKRLSDATDELADITAFILELLIFAGIDNDYMSDHLYKFVREYDLEAIWTEEPLELSFRIASWYHNQLNKYAKFATSKGREIIPEELIKNGMYKRYACRHHNPIMMEQNENIIFAIEHELMTATSFLKFKPWRDTPPPMQTDRFMDALMSTWLSTCWLFYANDLTSIDLMYFYNQKTQVNHGRAKDGY
jgi:hypothetical protein